MIDNWQVEKLVSVCMQACREEDLTALNLGEEVSLQNNQNAKNHDKN
ncbi:MAG: hypothetical protein KAX05_06125 [Bacteroidales bacterium]|nr:hypothetical protein [Bacteroidales bacterium]